MHRIQFYKVSEPYGEFSGFAPCAIELDDERSPTPWLVPLSALTEIPSLGCEGLPTGLEACDCYAL